MRRRRRSGEEEGERRAPPAEVLPARKVLLVVVVVRCAQSLDHPGHSCHLQAEKCSDRNHPRPQQRLPNLCEPRRRFL